MRFLGVSNFDLGLSASQYATILPAMTYDPDDIFTPFGNGATELSTQMCDWPSCDSEGEHPAPKSRERIREYRWFCIEHVRIYNRSWNYYEGMSDEQVDKLIRSDMTWNRPTWPLGERRRTSAADPLEAHIGPDNFGPGYENLSDPFGFFTEETSCKRSANKASKVPLSAEERKALSTLDLEISVTIAELKTRYKLLVKRYHPDVTGGDKKSEERFKQINEAYETIMNCLAPE